jgi:uncharacterized protein YndB with AHSA1/START domain
MGKWVLRAAAVLALAVAAIVILGYLLPVSHVATAEATFDRAPAEVYAAIADVRRYAEWRSDVERVEMLAEAPRTRWRESGSNRDITFVVEEAAAPSRLRTRIADPSLPFGGSWTYDVTPSGSGTTVRITERGEVYNPIFRVMSRFVFGHTATMEQFLRDLAEKLR